MLTTVLHVKSTKMNELEKKGHFENQKTNLRKTAPIKSTCAQLKISLLFILFFPLHC